MLQRMPSWAALANMTLPRAKVIPRRRFMLPQQNHATDYQYDAQPMATVDGFVKDEAGDQGNEYEIEAEHRIGDTDFQALQHQQPDQKAKTEREQRQPQPRRAKFLA